MKLLFNIYLLYYITKEITSTTSIKTYSTINVKENVKINTKIYEFTEPNNKNEMKLILLNLSGFERNYFEIKNENLYTINKIDREDFLNSKKCFDRSYCLIELHILVNDGQQYWVIPIHIVDENDNKPQFRNSLIKLKYHENIPNGYEIPFEGALDIDEGLNGQIRYILDCSSPLLSKSLKELQNLNKTSINCFPLFELKILSQSRLLNQYDQLALKYIPSKKNLLQNEYIENKTTYDLILYAIDSAEDNDKQLENSLKIQVEIEVEKFVFKPKFSLLNYKFIIKINSYLKKGTILGKVYAKSSNHNQLILYKIQNKTNDIEINSLTGELILLNENILSSTTNKIDLVVESYYYLNEYSTLKSLANVEIYFRLINQISQINIIYLNQSKLISQSNENPNRFSLNLQTNFTNEILFQLSILPSFYLFDKYIFHLDNYQHIFSLENSSLKIYSNSLIFNEKYLNLTIRIQHELTQVWLPNLIIQLITKQINENLCKENLIYNLYNFNQTNFIEQLKVLETNENNISLFTKYDFSSRNPNEIFINHCRMLFLNNNIQKYSHYKLCSLNDICYNITMIRNNQTNMFLNKNFKLFFKPIQIIIISFLIIFILSTITLFIIICRLQQFHLCLKIKNYLIYGKKYQLNNTEHLSSLKINQRTHSIVVRESQSPSIESMKHKSYVYSIDELIKEEPKPSTNISVDVDVPISLLCTSLVGGERVEERMISSIDNGTIGRILSSSSYTQETKQLLDMTSSYQDLNVSRLASEV
ncbi:unnamed protein product [Adineta steineri]|uniref:Cadherin domain-containing protein n=1 Tax=Adineta steineri TaxID=433720 RepID=A0A819WXY8_9BILA|nr:unnamed protein product [Adineta steineri]CAF4133703.1 unnamed protein product [Adineta steineri]